VTHRDATRRKPDPRLRKAEAELRRFALSYPDAWEDHPWGERVAKVGKKVFVFMSLADGGLTLSVKLPRSATLALGLPFASPTGYGLGKSGWVTSSFERGARPPIDVLKQWIDESYRAVASRTLLKRLDGCPAGPRAALRPV
jgi:predicted DNA-binding protein (MmcQ/YjbR family)